MMTTTAIIGYDSPLGKYWASKRYFDCLVNKNDYQVLKGREFGQVALVCPSLWDSPENIRENLKQFSDVVLKLIGGIGEARIERLTYVTSLDLIEAAGHENNRVAPAEETSYEGILAGLADFLELHFGRVLTIRVGELVGLEENKPGWSVLGEFEAAKQGNRKPKAGLLTRHQFYPVSRIAQDADTAWGCGLSSVNLVSDPLTTFELAERFFPELVDSLPVAKEQDPVGSMRTSLHAVCWNDVNMDYPIDRESLMESLKAL